MPCKLKGEHKNLMLKRLFCFVCFFVDTKLNTRRKFPYLLAPMYYPLYLQTPMFSTDTSELHAVKDFFPNVASDDYYKEGWKECGGDTFFSGGGGVAVN